MSSRVPLSALLSQALVAFTVELDNEFERQMGEAGCPGARLSLIVWLNLMRYIPAAGISFRSLSERTIFTDERLKHQLGCLERWGFVGFARAGRGPRDGFGSGRGVRADSIVAPTLKGSLARSIWPPLIVAIERRWELRFGQSAIAKLRDALGPAPSPELPLATLLGLKLLAFTVEFDRESEAPLAMCANTLRVVTAEGVRIADLARLTGSSPETTAIGWRLAGSGYVAVEGRMVGLTERGAGVQREYQRITAAIEKRWKSPVLREALEEILDHPLLREGLAPPAGVVRAGDLAPALGRRDVGSAARQRARDLVAQSQEFVRDPRGCLPHYPLWDMNRGFGP